MEEWRDIKGYEGLYQVSNLGRIKSLNYRSSNREEILKLHNNKKGYKQIRLSKEKTRKSYLVHRLVAQEFIPNPYNLPEINHKDECKYNNVVENLEWCTSKYNANYGTKIKRASNNNSGAKNYKSRKIKCVTTGEVFDTMTEASKKYNVQTAHLTDCCKGRRKTTGKHPITRIPLEWKYI